MAKKIISIGFELASNAVHYSHFEGKTSLLDWDIVLFRPNIETFIARSRRYGEHKYFQGKICLNDTQSFRAKEACAHWRRELLQAVESGKTVIIHLSRPDIVYAATGSTSTSGTGRNAKVTRHVEELSSYASLPNCPEPTIAQGSEMVICQEYRPLLASYWSTFGARSSYAVVFSEGTIGSSISTKHGNKPVGLNLSSKTSSGSILFLPDINFDDGDFFEEVDDEYGISENDEYQFNETARDFATAYVSEVVGLAKILRESSEKTPEPDWAKTERYALPDELRLREELLIAEGTLEKAQKQKEHIGALLADAGQLRDLLFETGKPLEAAILKALGVLGFTANSYEGENSEFDSVFESCEGRLLGEAEGRDNKQIAIGKLRQLSTNIHEDLQREEVDIPAKGILFGNAFRLTSPDKRGESFTEKCKNSAVSMSIGLVATPDLFRIVQFLSDNPDNELAKKCRELLVHSTGVVVFPETPQAIEAPPMVAESSE